MKLSTAKFLDTIEVENDGGSVLKRARMIFSGKVNDRLGAYITVHHISQSVYREEVIERIIKNEGINEDKDTSLSFDMELILLKLRLFSILDRKDAQKVWKFIKEPGNLELLQDNNTFFYHIEHGPTMLLTELIELNLFPRDGIEKLASVFPRSCIEEDYEEKLDINHSESATREWMGYLREELETAQKNGQEKEIERIGKQIKILEDNIARYL